MRLSLERQKKNHSLINTGIFFNGIMIIINRQTGKASFSHSGE